ncbi:nitroreductase/quinone reductase family protein [Streptomyces sp. NPDC048172]|uniref:nitroreductase/quinone reductase family protein n=1 Tax=Streptomyces sp. NPDC048172 TaxID=3365505 RepID=UPI003724887D
MTRKYVRPPWAARVIGARMARLFKPQVVSLLSVPGRTSAVWRSNPVAVLRYEGQEYLLAAYGDTEWSRNLRASGAGRLTRRGRVERFTAVEVPAEELPPLVEEYLRQYGKLPSVSRTFESLPDPADHPAFRITVTGREGELG